VDLAGEKPEYRVLCSNASIVDVVVDPQLSQLLRPHQREGVKVGHGSCSLTDRSLTPSILKVHVRMHHGDEKNGRNGLHTGG